MFDVGESFYGSNKVGLELVRKEFQRSVYQEIAFDLTIAWMWIKKKMIFIWINEVEKYVCYSAGRSVIF